MERKVPMKRRSSKSSAGSPVSRTRLRCTGRSLSSSRPMRDGSERRNQMCATGLASSMCPICSRRTLESVTSTPHFSHTTPRCLRRLYLPHRHS